MEFDPIVVVETVTLAVQTPLVVWMLLAHHGCPCRVLVALGVVWAFLAGNAADMAMLFVGQLAGFTLLLLTAEMLRGRLGREGVGQTMVRGGTKRYSVQFAATTALCLAVFAAGAPEGFWSYASYSSSLEIAFLVAATWLTARMAYSRLFLLEYVAQMGAAGAVLVVSRVTRSHWGTLADLLALSITMEGFVYIWSGAVSLVTAARICRWTLAKTSGAGCVGTRGKILRAACGVLCGLACMVIVALTIIVWAYLVICNDVPAMPEQRSFKPSPLLKLARAVPEEFPYGLSIGKARAAVVRSRPVLDALERLLSCPGTKWVPLPFGTTLDDLTALPKLIRLNGYAAELAEQDGDMRHAAAAYLNHLRIACVVDRDLPSSYRTAMGLEAAAAEGLHRIRRKLPGQVPSGLFKQIIWTIECRLDGLASGEDTLHNLHFVGLHPFYWQGRLRLAWSELSGEGAGAREVWHTLDAQRRLYLGLLLVEMGAEWHRHLTGEYPRSIEQLVPNYVHRVPSDPFSFQPIRLRGTEGTCVAYALGPDGDDDGGRPIADWWTLVPPDDPPPDGDVVLPERPPLLLSLE